MLRGTEESSQFQRKNHIYELKCFFSRDYGIMELHDGMVHTNGTSPKNWLIQIFVTFQEKTTNK